MVSNYLRNVSYSLELTSQHATLLTIVNIVYFYMYVYSFIGRTWGIDWLTCHKSMKYAGVIQFKLYLPRYASYQIPTYKLCLIVIRSKYATHIHHVFKNCLFRCARFAIYYNLAHSMFHRLLKFAFFVLLYVFFSSSSSYSEQICYYYVFNAVLIICKLL
jgi:hypothetical protein